MPITAKIICDSMAENGCRLTTYELIYPLMIHAELLTHKIFSRNAASNRAIPINKLLEQIEKEPATHVWWGKNEPGMQARAEVEDVEVAKAWWLESCSLAVAQARKGAALGLHKQVVNRVVMPFQHMTTILSGTSFSNFFALRDHEDAEPNFHALAKMMKIEHNLSVPKRLAVGEWHRPLILPEELGIASAPTLNKISVGRCARVSYLTHNGVRDVSEDIKLHDRLKNNGHWSPFEHVAQAMSDRGLSGNFMGWKQYRKLFPNEHIGGLML